MALLIDASHWFSEFELLFNTSTYRRTFHALKRTMQEFWFDFSCSSDCTMDGHQSSETHDLQIANLLDLRHVVITKLKLFFFGELETKICDKLCQGFFQERFKALVLLDDSSHEIEATIFIKFKLHQM
jgi:acetolactate synthase regulatory subunit